jgi:hypothetical protein
MVENSESMLNEIVLPQRTLLRAMKVNLCNNKGLNIDAQKAYHEILIFWLMYHNAY